MRKCKGIEEVVTKGGVKMTRARTILAENTSTSKRRKVDGGELELSPSLVQLETQNLSIMTPENSAPGNSTCESVSTDHVLASCCSSNESGEEEKENSKFVDLELHEENEIGAEFETRTYDLELEDCRESRVTTPTSEVEAEVESTARSWESNARRRSCSTMQKMPSENELEEFFATAEKDLHKQFIDKYNFDILEDKPLEGRYEWIELNPQLGCTNTETRNATRCDN
ncbi:cyclin-dependent kinase inhibitor 7-like [Olea europaea subsp. europaea]|uniref:Cyclin-dependent kinase inhibitor 7-like n=1 Tax=Olea europaea subsp. europaea TaxID=158383 RepID=A0A8S0QLQ6_OLEEU|nr:cyclin-dependent kinase inhibitor 7-like [Olea europaea subsp. europaea]